MGTCRRCRPQLGYGCIPHRPILLRIGLHTWSSQHFKSCDGGVLFRSIPQCTEVTAFFFSIFRGGSVSLAASSGHPEGWTSASRGGPDPFRKSPPALLPGSLVRSVPCAGDRPAVQPSPQPTAADRLAHLVDGAFHSGTCRAVLVVYRGRLIAERYAPSFTAHTSLEGHSAGFCLGGVGCGSAHYRGAVES